MSPCQDCEAGEHLRSECPAHLPCAYWADHVHCFTTIVTGEWCHQTPQKTCRCGVSVGKHT